MCQVHAKILSAGWSPDGLHLALGFFDGNVGIRDVNGVEKVTITRCVTTNIPGRLVNHVVRVRAVLVVMPWCFYL